MRVTLLAGGVGGARMARALATTIGPDRLTVIGNVGDDLEHFGLHVSPDLDTVVYTLAGLIDETHGWGVAGDTTGAMDVAVRLGLPDWFTLGDRDLGVHLARTARLRAGEPLSSITASIARELGCAVRLLPGTDDRLRTRIETADGVLEFHDWLVRRRAVDVVAAVAFDGLPVAPAPGVIDAIAIADLVVLAPSNPFVSLDPILAVDGVRAAVGARRPDVVAVTPIIAGEAVKGPLRAMLESLGHAPSAVAIASYLAPLTGGFVLDRRDASLTSAVEALGLRVACADTNLREPTAAAATVQSILDLARG